MDEGLVLSYATRVLHGGVPFRDFPYYGPANLWDIAGAFAVFGARQSVERTVGLLYVVITVVGIYLIVRRTNRRAAAVSVVITTAIAADTGIWAYVTRPAVAFLVLSILLSTSRERVADRGDRAVFAAAGFFAGWTLLCRIDFVLCIAPASLVVLAGVGRTARRIYLAALAGTVALAVPYLVLSGLSGIHRNLREFTASAQWRRLPLPSPLSLPTGGLFFGGAIALGLLVAGSVVVWERGRDARPLAAVAVSTAGAIPLILSRADEAHIAPIALLLFGALPLAAVELTNGLPGRLWLSRLVRCATVIATMWGVWFVVLTLPRGVVDAASTARQSPYRGTEVESHSRTFLLSERHDAESVQRVLDMLNTSAQRGQSLFVGPQDLRRAVYGPTYLYFLLPQLRPASYYTVINPGVVNGRRSTLAHDLVGADWLILTSQWDHLPTGREPSDTLVGPALPNDVVRTRFCIRVAVGSYRLYESLRLAHGSLGGIACRAASP